MTLRESAFAAVILKALKDAVAAEESNARVFALGDITEAFEAMGVKSVEVPLPDGTKVATLTLAGGDEKPAITDDDAFLNWVEANHPTEVETVKRVRSSYTAAVLKAGVDPTTGEVPDGVEDRRTSRYISVRYTPDGREAIARAWQRGELAAITPYPEQLPEVEAAS